MINVFVSGQHDCSTDYRNRCGTKCIMFGLFTDTRVGLITLCDAIITLTAREKIDPSV